VRKRKLGRNRNGRMMRLRHLNGILRVITVKIALTVCYALWRINGGSRSELVRRENVNYPVRLHSSFSAVVQHRDTILNRNTVEVQYLPDCWYGNECHAQGSPSSDGRPSHAERYNVSAS
jgi:hypothetical protein